MIDIRPVTDLRDNFPEIENTVQSGNPVYLTENGYGRMVVLSLTQYSELINQMEYDKYVEKKLLEADEIARNTNERMTHEEVFGRIRRLINERKV